MTTSSDSASITILGGRSAGTFAAPLPCNVGAQPRRVAAKDLDGDGSVDLVGANEGSRTVTALLARGE